MRKSPKMGSPSKKKVSQLKINLQMSQREDGSIALVGPVFLGFPVVDH